jgi:hypothetical protein
MANAAALLAGPPVIEKVDLPAIKWSSPGTSPEAMFPVFFTYAPIDSWPVGSYQSQNQAGSNGKPGTRQASFCKIKHLRSESPAEHASP